MKTKDLVLLSLLVGIGAVLHTVIPPILFGMKPDMLLAMMFLGIILFPKPHHVLLLSVVTGFISALTTGAPGGQIANLIDKPITAFVFLGLFLFLKEKGNINIIIPMLTAFGTIISGSIFLTVTLFIVNLMEGGFITLFVGIVLPAAIVNTIVMTIVYPIAQGVLKRIRPKTI
ncbi:hypothetical protein HNQ35_001600 [Cerasibacillus quisquiliarum]|uniref:Putative tryptophan transport protein n=1 Tax=Cerasibacillus quisquiliarum TaxID=227865 RepID=A0A511UVS2_9BACI|nr:tryptophan transporter [Cerasibacillus quisquiliarum]MBB5146398.1 hypothetical protein [Cerasibacillus quisquiliarum]GEN30725.1 putative tryptophan transport protein [Cerasibacillus quisquiliarum]